MKKTILITGITGAVGQSIVPTLKRAGYRLIYLAREKNGISGKNRVERILGIHLTVDDVCVEGDLVSDLCLDPLLWQGKIGCVLHCAGSVSFNDNEAIETWLTNVSGTLNLLRVAEDLKIPHFHYISTAYVAGSSSVFHEKDFDIGQKTRNAYEESKLAAEDLVRKRAGAWTIHRLSVVIGDSRTFSTTGFDGYYGFFQPLWRLRQHLMERGKKEAGYLQEQGVSFRGDRLLIPLNISCSLDSTLNLITSDWLAEMLVVLLDSPSALTASKTYHLVDPSPQKVKWVIDTTLTRMGIDGVVVGSVHPLEQGSLLLGKFQKMLEKGLEMFSPYSNHEARFSSDQLACDLGNTYRAPPSISKDLLENMIEYAMAVNFGKKCN